MRLPPRAPGSSRAKHRELVRQLTEYDREYRAFSDGHELFGFCPRAQCRRARRCMTSEQRLCVREFVAWSGDEDFWQPLFRRMAHLGSALTPQQQMSAPVRDAIDDDDDEFDADDFDDECA